MSKLYLVNWSDEGIDDALEVANNTPYGAYKQFLDVNKPRSVSVMVWTTGDVADTDEFDDHLDESPKKSQSRSQEVPLTDETQQEILKQLKQINWAIRIGFLFIMAVVSGIIKPGIFG